jgi:hypothetical protein
VIEENQFISKFNKAFGHFYLTNLILHYWESGTLESIYRPKDQHIKIIEDILDIKLIKKEDFEPGFLWDK